jgi:hypothetical protein
VSCPACKTHTLVQITMKVASEKVTFSSCSACDLRWWSGAGGPVRLGSVLERAASR